MTDPVEKALSKSSNTINWLNGLITLVIVLLGLGVTWGTTRSEIKNQQKAIEELKADYTTDVKSLEARVLELQLFKATIDSRLKGIEDKLQEVSTDLKEALRNNR